MCRKSCIYESKTPPKSGPLVQPQHTKVRRTLPRHPQAQWRRFDEAEWLAAETHFEQNPGHKSQSQLTRFRECRTKAWYYGVIATGQIIRKSNSCNLRWCPLCARAKANSIARNVKDWLDHAWHPKMLTLTMKHSNAPLKQQLDDLHKHVRKLRISKLFRSKCRGGILFYQVHRSKNDGFWHLHIHLLIDSHYIPQDQLSKLWLKITGTSNVVDIRSVRDNEYASKEVSRYCAKPCRLSEHSIEDGYILIDAFFNRRLSSSWGTGKQCSLKPKPQFTNAELKYLCSYETIYEKYNSDLRVREIHYCYEIGETFDLNQDLDGLEDTVHQEIESGEYDEELGPLHRKLDKPP